MYHVNNNGEPGQCTAQSGNCPFGSTEDHYSSSQEARAAYENSMANNSLPAPVELHNRCERCGSRDASVQPGHEQCDNCVEYNTCEVHDVLHNLDGYCDEC